MSVPAVHTRRLTVHTTTEFRGLDPVLLVRSSIYGSIDPSAKCIGRVVSVCDSAYSPSGLSIEFELDGDAQLTDETFVRFWDAKNTKSWRLYLKLHKDGSTRLEKEGIHAPGSCFMLRSLPIPGLDVGSLTGECVHASRDPSSAPVGRVVRASVASDGLLGFTIEFELWGDANVTGDTFVCCTIKSEIWRLYLKLDPNGSQGFRTEKVEVASTKTTIQCKAKVEKSHMDGAPADLVDMPVYTSIGPDAKPAGVIFAHAECDGIVEIYYTMNVSPYTGTREWVGPAPLIKWTHGDATHFVYLQPVNGHERSWNVVRDPSRPMITTTMRALEGVVPRDLVGLPIFASVHPDAKPVGVVIGGMWLSPELRDNMVIQYQMKDDDASSTTTTTIAPSNLFVRIVHPGTGRRWRVYLKSAGHHQPMSVFPDDTNDCVKLRLTSLLDIVDGIVPSRLENAPVLASTQVNSLPVGRVISVVNDAAKKMLVIHFELFTDVKKRDLFVRQWDNKTQSVLLLYLAGRENGSTKIAHERVTGDGRVVVVESSEYKMADVEPKKWGGVDERKVDAQPPRLLTAFDVLNSSDVSDDDMPELVEKKDIPADVTAALSLLKLDRERRKELPSGHPNTLKDESPNDSPVWEALRIMASPPTDENQRALRQAQIDAFMKADRPLPREMEGAISSSSSSSRSAPAEINFDYATPDELEVLSAATLNKPYTLTGVRCTFLPRVRAMVSREQQNTSLCKSLGRLIEVLTTPRCIGTFQSLRATEDPIRRCFNGSDGSMVCKLSSNPDVRLWTPKEEEEKMERRNQKYMKRQREDDAREDAASLKAVREAAWEAASEAERKVRLAANVEAIKAVQKADKEKKERLAANVVGMKAAQEENKEREAALAMSPDECTVLSAKADATLEVIREKQESDGHALYFSQGTYDKKMKKWIPRSLHGLDEGGRKAAMDQEAMMKAFLTSVDTIGHTEYPESFSKLYNVVDPSGGGEIELWNDKVLDRFCVTVESDPNIVHHESSPVVTEPMSEAKSMIPAPFHDRVAEPSVLGLTPPPPTAAATTTTTTMNYTTTQHDPTKPPCIIYIAEDAHMLPVVFKKNDNMCVPENKRPRYEQKTIPTTSALHTDTLSVQVHTLVTQTIDAVTVWRDHSHENGSIQPHVAISIETYNKLAVDEFVKWAQAAGYMAWSNQVMSKDDNECYVVVSWAHLPGVVSRDTSRQHAIRVANMAKADIPVELRAKGIAHFSCFESIDDVVDFSRLEPVDDVDPNEAERLISRDEYTMYQCGKCKRYTVKDSDPSAKHPGRICCDCYNKKKKNAAPASQ